MDIRLRFDLFNDSWLHKINVFLGFAVILQVFDRPLKSDLLSFFQFFSSVQQQLVKVLQKPNIMLALSSQLSYAEDIEPFRLKIKRKVRQNLDKN